MSAFDPKQTFDPAVYFVVLYAAGGGTDIVARAQKLGLTLGQNFVVENKTGASGMIGAEFVAKSDADGYARAAMLAVAFVSDIRQ